MALPAEPIVTLEHADRLEHLEKEQLVILSGHVRIRFETNTIQADTIRLNLATNTIIAEGNLIWDAADHHARGSRMTFNTKTQEGVVEDVTMTTGLWICRGKRVVQPEPNLAIVQPGMMTTCDLERPHYSIKCKRIRIRLDRDLTATNVTFFVGSTPVFWLPLLVMPTKEFRLPFQAQFGATQELGAFVRTSPAYQLGPRLAGQAHVDFFQNKGWGYGVTQDWSNAKGQRILRGHGYYIKERIGSRQLVTTPQGITRQLATPRQRWEVFGEGSHAFSPSTRLLSRVAYISDAHFRELYGNLNLALPTTAGQRTAMALLSQKLPGANASMLVQRTETQRLLNIQTRESRYALSTIHAPQLNITGKPKSLTSWLSTSLRGKADRMWRWQNEWYVNSVGVTPSLEGFGRLPVLGGFTVTPRLQATWRDRGDRILLRKSDGSVSFTEDVNRRGGLYRGLLSSSLRPPVPFGLGLDFSHQVVQRLNKRIGRDPLDQIYRGLERHAVQARLSFSFGDAGSAALSQGYDLRNRQDPVRRRWSPLSPQLTLTPHRNLTIQGELRYDLWDQEWRKEVRSVFGNLTYRRGRDDLSVTLMPRFTNNRLDLPVATTSAQAYRLSRHLYGPSFQDALRFPTIFLVDGEVTMPLTRRIRIATTGQYNMTARKLQYYTLSVARNLHCWELVGTFQKFISGDLRFHLSMGLAAWPNEAFPLLGF